MSELRWTELAVNLDGERVEFIGDLLMDRGALSILVEGEEDRFETELGEIPVWPMARLAAIFDLEATCARTLDAILEELTGLSLEVTRRDFTDQNWELISLERYQPQRIIESLWVVPDWHEPPEPDAHNIIVNPGLAFGTGEHPTTKGCMRVLYRLYKEQELNEKTVLDMGCGSGILAIVALKLGASFAVATDIDIRALEVTQENSHKNGVAPYIDAVSLDTIEENRQYDVVIANILAGTLIELAPTLQSYVNKGGLIILSGLLNAQKERVKEAFDYFDNWQEEPEDDWVTLYAYS